ncbi:apolipoprotein N-acyltransferase [Aliiroseovarius sp. F20344]|uniref:apolipoprotein N-acyltransferase n=1 Tax=Aliiroseovarius sp. F20344 TaxID=2926414 RepID=UPI001FF4EF95|nr:apolipoprotein N-acyltransferase [Aliiroseovarius sp. F20344]MCK0141730.1 apolipoprotein N-acyltransferase [Aliiroseovarius sp. F20344]
MPDIDACAARIAAHPSWRVVVLIVAGVIAALGQAPFQIWAATLAGLLVGYLIWRHSHSPRIAALHGWLLGLGYFTVTMSWLVNPFFVEPDRHGWMAPFALLGMAGGLSLLWALGWVVARWLAGPQRRLEWLLWPAGMTAAELLRGTLFTGFPWGGPGLAWIDTSVAQLASWIGVAGLTFLSLIWVCLLAAFIVGRTAKGLWALGGLTAVLGLATFLVSTEPPGNTEHTLRLVQPNAPQHQKWDPDYAESFVERQLQFTAAEPEGADLDLIIWPETSVPSLLEHVQWLLPHVADAANGKPVLLGIQRADGQRYFNSLAMVEPDGSAHPVYDKHHLVPFGEYIPFGDAMLRFGIRAFASQLGQGYSAGPGPVVLDLGPLGTVLPLICYEAVFPRDIRNAPTRPDWLLQVTNDAWFGDFSGPQQHLVQARFRAIEFGLPIIRVANTGISASINAHGRVMKSLPLGQAGFLDVTLPDAQPETIYARFGDIPLFLLLACVALAAISTRSRFSR